MASNAKALSFLSGDLSLSGTEVSINVAGSVQSDSITGSTITMKNTGSTIVASDGSTAVLSESGGTVTLTADEAVIEGSSSGDLVRITQTGTGNALVVEDSSNPDSTPFVVTTDGLVGIGTSSPSSNLEISAATNTGVRLTTTADSTPFLDFRTNGTDRLRISSSSATGATFNVRSNQDMQFYTNNAPRMIIDSSGNVGIGTSVPSYKLHIRGADATSNFVVGSTVENTQLEVLTHQDDRVVLRSNDNGNGRALAFETGTTERMRIDSSGNLLVGTTTNGTTADGTVIRASGEVLMTRTNGQPLLLNRAGTDGTIIEFRKSNSFKGSISINTTAVAFNTTSDYRLKENITEITDGVTRVKQLNPSRFNFIADPDRIVDGFLAHEVQDIVPEAITGEKDAVNEDGSINSQGIDQSKLVPLLTAALQEAIGLIESQQSQIDTLTDKTQEQDFTIASLISRIEALENP
jgi:hypothetical protein